MSLGSSKASEPYWLLHNYKSSALEFGSSSRMQSAAQQYTVLFMQKKGAVRGAKCASATHEGGAPLGFHPYHTSTPG